ncbi:hypothetical protein CEXT_306081 [Caerostris extrusa]|uniref:Uncharacterized protein n=1 Tax=Caerostris extrusa TaxID=172846 RepID=A0AAV4V0K0_CAEEX|nr:hypothetical protein CEXT_306081 [Caerostris extrusa]
MRLCSGAKRFATDTETSISEILKPCWLHFLTGRTYLQVWRRRPDSLLSPFLAESGAREKRRGEKDSGEKDARDEDDIPETTPTSSLDSGPTDRETDDGRLLPSQPPQTILFFPIILVTPPSPESPRGLCEVVTLKKKKEGGKKS